MEFLIVLLVALLAAAIISGYVEYQAKKKAERINKELAGQLEYLNKTNSFHHSKAHEWKERFELLEGLAVEEREKNKKQIAELKKELAKEREAKKRWAQSSIVYAKEQRTTWHAHQVCRTFFQTVCLTAIVTAEDGPGAVAAFEAQMKEVKAKLRIRSKAPVFAKPVFPNY